MFMPLYGLIGQLLMMFCSLSSITQLEQEYVLHYLNTHSAGPFELSYLEEYYDATDEEIVEQMGKIFRFLSNEPDISRLQIIWDLTECIELDGYVSDEEQYYFYLFINGLRKVSRFEEFEEYRMFE